MIVAKNAVRAIMLAGAAIALATVPRPVGATDDNAQSVVRAYLNGLGYGNVTFSRSSMYGACPSGFRCIGWTALVAYSVSGDSGEGGSVALVTGGDRCPACGNVLTAGGGSLTVDGIMSYGVPQSQAQDMMNQYGP